MASESHNVDRTVLPPPDPPFEGKIDVAFKDLEPNFPEPLRAPEGAPECAPDHG